MGEGIKLSDTPSSFVIEALEDLCLFDRTAGAGDRSDHGEILIVDDHLGIEDVVEERESLSELGMIVDEFSQGRHVARIPLETNAHN